MSDTRVVPLCFLECESCFRYRLHYDPLDSHEPGDAVMRRGTELKYRHLILTYITLAALPSPPLTK